MVNEELLTIKEMAARLKVHPSWLYSRTRIRGHEAMPGVIRCGKYLRFKPEMVVAWIKQKYGDVEE